MTPNRRKASPRKAPLRKPGTWLRQQNAADALGLKRTTLIGRMARGQYITKTEDDVTFVWVADDERRDRAA